MLNFANENNKQLKTESYMKKFEDFTKEDLAKLRSEIVLNSIYYADYRNSFGIHEKSMCDFFDSYMDYLAELCEEDGKELSEENIYAYDNIDNLESWYYCYDDFDWVQYEDDED